MIFDIGTTMEAGHAGTGMGGFITTGLSDESGMVVARLTITGGDSEATEARVRGPRDVRFESGAVSVSTTWK